MTELDQVAAAIALSMGAAWASGLNLYAAILVLGLGGATGNIVLPETLQIVQDPMVLLAAGLMYCVEFFADKTPGVDTGWDAIHTFIRVPAGALLAAGAVGEVAPAMELAAGIVGGSLSMATHSAKAGTRVMINTSPEPFSNWTASVAEDVAVIAGLWTALNHPYIFLGLLALFILLLIWLLPKLWRGVRLVFRKLGQWLGLVAKDTAQAPPTGSAADELMKLQRLRQAGALTDEEFQVAKQRLLAGGATHGHGGEDRQP